MEGEIQGRAGAEEVTQSDGICRDARFSGCQRYRWSLERWWNVHRASPWIGWILLNPSTADDRKDDPTIHRCIRYSQAWGYGGCTICNLFALRSTSPRAAYHDRRPIGRLNDRAILAPVEQCGVIVAAWGVHGALSDRGENVMRMLIDAGVKVHCLGRTKDGHPRHPLYLRSDRKLVRFATLRRSVISNASSKRRESDRSL